MERPEKLFPEIEPRSHGYLTTDDGHAIYFEECGNLNGKPITFIHGGPGAGCEAKDRRWFDPEKWRIILFDQRGCGRSRPLGNIQKNTTQDLATDIVGIFKQLGIEKSALFGGSWGVTLAKVFEIMHPEKVSGLILRGVFLGEKKEIDYYLNGKVALTPHAKEAWERFKKHDGQGWGPLKYYHHQMVHGNMFRKMYYAYEWARYEVCIAYSEPRTELEIEQEIKSCPYEAWALIEAHYFVNNCFLEDNFIINNSREKTSSIPVVIVQGKNDMICPPINAIRLHQAIPGSKLHLTDAGHSSSEPETLKKLVSETDALYDLI